MNSHPDAVPGQCLIEPRPGILVDVAMRREYERQRYETCQ
jgi:hypothetical protein